MVLVDPLAWKQITSIEQMQTLSAAGAALDAALANTKSFTLIEVDLDPDDASPAMRRLGERLGKRVKGKTE